MSKILLILCSLFGSFLQAESAPSFSYSFEHYYDQENIYNITNISKAPFKPISPVIVFKNKPRTHWYKIAIENSSNKREDIVIYNAKSYYKTIKYYEIDRENRVISYSNVSKNIAYGDKDFLSTLPAFRFELEAGSKKVIYIETEADIYFISKFYVTTEDGFRLSREKQNFFYIFYLGISLAIGIYFLVLFIINKEILYLYYFIYTLLLAHFSYIYSALYVYINGNWLYYGFAILPLTYVFLLLITEKMVENDKKIPYFKQITQTFNISFVVAGLIMLFDQTLASHVYHVLLLLLIILANVLLFSSSKKNRIYFIAVFIYLISMVSMPLLSMQIIPYNFMTKNIILFGSLIELFLFSFVLAKHVQAISIEKLKSEAKLSEVQKDQNKRLQIQVEKQTKSLNYLFKELQHRVKNNFQFILTFLWMQETLTKEKKVLNAIKQTKDRVYAIASIHELLYLEQKTTLNLRFYLEKIVDSFQKDIKKVEIKRDIKNIVLDYNNNMALGLILNELLTNSFKYAFKEVEKPLIKLIVYEKNKKVYFIYSDNGLGFDKEILENSKGFGYEFIREFSNTLQNKYTTLDTKNGFLFKLVFSY